MANNLMVASTLTDLGRLGLDYARNDEAARAAQAAHSMEIMRLSQQTAAEQARNRLYQNQLVAASEQHQMEMAQRAMEANQRQSLGMMPFLQSSVADAAHNKTLNSQIAGNAAQRAMDNASRASLQDSDNVFKMAESEANRQLQREQLRIQEEDLKRRYSNGFLSDPKIQQDAYMRKLRTPAAVDKANAAFRSSKAELAKSFQEAADKGTYSGGSGMWNMFSSQSSNAAKAWVNGDDTPDLLSNKTYSPTKKVYDQLAYDKTLMALGDDAELVKWDGSKFVAAGEQSTNTPSNTLGGGAQFFGPVTSPVGELPGVFGTTPGMQFVPGPIGPNFVAPPVTGAPPGVVRRFNPATGRIE